MDWMAQEISMVTSQNVDKEEGSLRGLCLTGAWGSSSPCLEKDPHIAKYSENMFDTQISQEQAYQKGDGSASLVTITRKGSVCSTSWGPRRLVSEISQANWENCQQCKCGPDTRGQKLLSVWHPYHFPVPASRTGRESQSKNSCSGTIGPPTAVAQCQGCAVGCKHRNTLSEQQEMKLIFRCRHFAERAKGTKQMSGSLQYSSPLVGTPLEQ